MKIFSGLSFDMVVMFLLLSCGIYLTLSFKLFQIRGFKTIWKWTIGTLFKKDSTTNKEEITPFQAMTTALAGTMGVGNIAGVATALIAGGPGAIFWMWISAFFGMITKYCEIYLSVKFRKRVSDGCFIGGPMYYMNNCIGGKILAAIFAIACALCSLGIGNMAQVNSVSTAMQTAFGIPPIFSGIVVAIMVSMVVLGGVKRITRVTEFIIPFISIIYISGACAFLFIHRQNIISAFSLIVSCAFSSQTAASGILGYSISQAMRFGLSRGVFTNEAGLGSAPIVHATANCKSPAHQSVWGIFEVFLDTIVVCTITALVLLLAVNGTMWHTSGLDGSALTAAAFGSIFGDAGVRFIAISILFFAVAAMLGWCYYGESAVSYLSNGNKKYRNIYRLIFIVCILPGATANLTLIWGISDYLNAFMALPNIFAIIILRKYIEVPTKILK